MAGPIRSLLNKNLFSSTRPALLSAPDVPALRHLDTGIQRRLRTVSEPKSALPGPSSIKTDCAKVIPINRSGTEIGWFAEVEDPQRSPSVARKSRSALMRFPLGKWPAPNTWNGSCLRVFVRLKLPLGSAEQEVSPKVVPMLKGRLNQSNNTAALSQFSAIAFPVRSQGVVKVMTPCPNTGQFKS